MKTLIVSQYRQVRELYKKYERLLMPATLVGGFLLDYFTFTAIQINTTFLLLFGYWLLAGVFITFSHVYDSRPPSTLPAVKYARLFSPLVVQFVFGSLLGASLIFYWFGGAFSVSWPLMVVIVALLIFNDTFRHYFEKPLVQISVYFFATFSLLSLWLPFVFHSLSEWLFISAGAVSLVIFLGYIYWLARVAHRLRAQWKWLVFFVVAITVAMNALYFTNIIPPIPLALREAGLYHSLKVSGDHYVMEGEYENFLKVGLFGQTLHVEPSNKIYLYTAIFAPDELKATIVHHWQYYDEAKKEWVSRGKLEFDINGGRQEGYKGYSWQSDLEAGRWRVYVQNQRGQVLGRVRFNVEVIQAPPIVQEVVR